MPDVGQSVTFEPMQQAYWPEVRAICLEGIAVGNATCRLIARHLESTAGWSP